MAFFSKMFNAEKTALTKEQKEIEKKIKRLNQLQYDNKKILSPVSIENSYFGNGILVKDSTSENACYIWLLSGFNNHSFGDKSDDSYDLYDILIQEDNLDYVLTSLEQIYTKSDQIMEECYDEIYKEILKFFEENSGSDWDIRLKDEFDLEYLKENWYVKGVAIYDDHVEISIGIKAANNPEHDGFYDINLFVDYSSQEPDVSFDIVW